MKNILIISGTVLGVVVLVALVLFFSAPGYFANGFGPNGNFWNRPCLQGTPGNYDNTNINAQADEEGSWLSNYFCVRGNRGQYGRHMNDPYYYRNHRGYNRGYDNGYSRGYGYNNNPYCLRNYDYNQNNQTDESQTNNEPSNDNQSN